MQHGKRYNVHIIGIPKRKEMEDRARLKRFD